MIYFKYIILGLVFLISTEIGFIKANSFKTRTEELTKIESSLYFFITKIEYTNETIKEIFNQISKTNYKNENNIFHSTVVELGNNNLENAWEKSILKDENLKAEDIEILKVFGKSLGKLDKRGQMGQIQETIELIKKQIKIAEVEKEKNVKLFKSLGSIFGAIIILILI